MTYKRKEVIGDCTLYLGDCLSIMPTLGKVDAVVTDPPYGVGYNGSTTKHGKNGFSYNGFDDTPEYINSLCVPAVRYAMSISDCGIMTPGNANSHLYDPPRAQGCIFYPSGANSGPWGFVCSQPLFYYGSDPYLKNCLGRKPNGFSTTESTDRDINHPCPKPYLVTKWMVERVSLQGHSVLDIFMGSGTTGVACAKMGRSFIGIELDSDYFDLSCRRIEEAYKQPDMFIESPVKFIQDKLI